MQANPTEEILGEACDRCEEKVMCSTVLILDLWLNYPNRIFLDFGTEFRLLHQ